jgi:hypothetical protein
MRGKYLLLDTVLHDEPVDPDLPFGMRNPGLDQATLKEGFGGRQEDQSFQLEDLLAARGRRLSWQGELHFQNGKASPARPLLMAVDAAYGAAV